MPEPIYTEGLTFFPPKDKEKYPWDQGQLSVHLDQFSEWLRGMARDTDDKGRIRLDIVEQKSRPGKFSIKLNTYKKQERAPEPEPEEESEVMPF